MLVICAGLPRSGSTDLYNKICSILECVSKCERHGRYDYQSSKKFQNTKYKWAADKNIWHVIKANPTKDDFEKTKTGKIKIIQIVRDIRDACASAQIRWGHRWIDNTKNILEFAELVSKKYYFFIDFEKNENMLQLKYEDCIISQGNYIDTLSMFLQVTLTKKDKKLVLNQTSIQNMKKISDGKYLKLSRNIKEKLTFFVKFVRSFLPEKYKNKRLNLFKKLKILPKYETQTLIGPGHISQTNGKIGIYKDVLDKKVANFLSKKYNLLVHY